MKLIITEKPSVATDFIKILETDYERKDGYYEGEEYVITWCIGHLITLCYPEAYGEQYKKWSFDTLPFIPSSYKYQIIPDEKTKAQFKVVKACLNRSDIDTIYYAGDSAREGEYIQRLVRQCAGHNPNAKEYRIWIDSQTEDEIKRGVKEAKPLTEYDKMSDSGYMRAIEDYLLGINFSRALSIKYGQAFNRYIKSSNYVPISVGRVMTCVLGMIVDRERQIRNAEEIPFYGIKGILENGLEVKWKSTDESNYFESPLLFRDDSFKEERDASAFVDELIKRGFLTVETIKKTTEKKSAPLLCSLAELQNECAKLFKISSDETLKVVQSLYDKKLTTYPRTDASVLSEAVAKEIRNNIKGLTSVPELKGVAEKILENGSYKTIKDTKYTNDAAISDHYAIIPTGHTNGLNDLSELETNVYNLISKRFLSIFLPSAIYEKTTIVLKSEKESFFVSSKMLSQAGYLELYDIQEDTEKDSDFSLIDSLQEGERIRTDFSVSKGTTSAPKRYTSGSIIIAMKNAGNTVEDEELRNLIKSSGIGTSATRSETILKLIKNGYITLDKKTQILKPSASGEILYEIIKTTLPSLLSINMTASWEKGLTQIVDGVISRQNYNDKMNSYIITEIDKIKNGNAMEEIEEQIKILRKIYSNIGTGNISNNSAGPNDTGIKCPRCGKPIIKYQWGFGCSGYKDGCKFSVGKNIFGAVNLKDEQIEKLLTSGKVKNITFHSEEKNKNYKASLKLDKESGTIKIIFDSKK